MRACVKLRYAASGEGQSVCYRAPDRSLLAFIIYTA
jgi:hypothetical protein